MKWISDRNLERLRDELESPDVSGTKYRIISRIGSGGMGTVYLAQDQVLGRKVALKVTGLTAIAELAPRMMREAQIVALLEHPSIVPIHDVGTLPDNRVYYVMKLVEGKRLDEYAAQIGSLPERLRIFQKVCEAVAFAHAHSVVHRDLKPENIMVGPFGEVLVMDWGVAKLLAEVERKDGAEQRTDTARAIDIEIDQIKTLPLTLSPGSETQTAGGTIIGTPAYMSPEQASGQTELVDQRSDVYALGGILYFLLTSRTPIQRHGPTESIIRPRQVNRKIPRTIEAVALKALSSRRELRYAGAQHVSDDIVRFLDGKPVSAYRENVLETAVRFLNQNRFLVLLVLAYLVMRLIVFFWFGN